MKRFMVPTAMLIAASMVTACGKKQAEQPAPEAPRAEAPVVPAVATTVPPVQPAVTAAPAPRHGGQVVAAGEYYAEIEAGAKEIECNFYGSDGAPISAAQVGPGKLYIVMADGDKADAAMKVHEDHLTTGEALAHIHFHPPYDGAVSVTIGGALRNFRFSVGK